MTNLFTTLLFVAIATAANATCQQKAERNNVYHDTLHASNIVLKISARVFTEGDPATKFKVRVYEKNKCIAELEYTKDNHVMFQFRSNEEYTLEILKDGYYPKRISFNTDFPKPANMCHIFPFDVFLTEIETHCDDFVFDFPAAIVYYDGETASFRSNVQYQRDIFLTIRETLNSKKNKK